MTEVTVILRMTRQ